MFKKLQAYWFRRQLARAQNQVLQSSKSLYEIQTSLTLLTLITEDKLETLSMQDFATQRVRMNFANISHYISSLREINTAISTATPFTLSESDREIELSLDQFFVDEADYYVPPPQTYACLRKEALKLLVFLNNASTQAYGYPEFALRKSRKMTRDLYHFSIGLARCF